MSLYRRVANLFCRAKLERDIDVELRSHIQLRIDDNIAAGMAPEEARRDALLRFGRRNSFMEEARAADTAVVLDGMARDIRHAARQVRKSPDFAITAIVTLALAIAANVVVFSVLNALVLRAVNVAGSDRLFQVVNKNRGNISQSYPDYLDYRSQNTTFRDMAVYRIGFAGLSTGAAAYKCWLYEVSGSYFGMLGVKPEFGRFFDSHDERGPNSAPYIVLSDAFWRSHFGGDRRIIGKTVDLNKQPFTIIGIAPREFHGIEQFFWPDLFLPIVNERQIEGFDFLSNRFSHGSFVIGMLKPGVSAQQASENLNAIAHTLAKHYKADEGLYARLVNPGLIRRSDRRTSTRIPVRDYDHDLPGSGRSMHESGRHICCARFGSGPRISHPPRDRFEPLAYLAAAINGSSIGVAHRGCSRNVGRCLSAADAYLLAAIRRFPHSCHSDSGPKCLCARAGAVAVEWNLTRHISGAADLEHGCNAGHERRREHDGISTA
ncbi:MAG: ABC transporter permease [Acidobacteriaceae bacterium]|nr:ABC transporter permease [Acidobacteriaceae bacterium]